MTGYLLVGLGGAIGAMARYAVSGAAGRLWPGAFPYGTLIVNVAGSLLMGLLIGLLARLLPAGQDEMRLFVAVGILGGFTTFSAFSLDAVALFERGETWQAAAYVGLSVVLSIGALAAGLLAIRAIPS